LRETVTILCPGPSLANAPQVDGIVYGINRAAILRPVTHWVALDWISDLPGGGIINWALQVQGSPELITSKNSKESLLRKGFKWPTPITEIESSWNYLDPHKNRFSIYSATSALVYAASMGAKRIDIYGMTMAGTQDADGIVAGYNRTPARWEMESQIVSNLIAILNERGIEVRRN